jgi:hypothetical protein
VWKGVVWIVVMPARGMSGCSDCLTARLWENITGEEVDVEVCCLSNVVVGGVALDLTTRGNVSKIVGGRIEGLRCIGHSSCYLYFTACVCLVVKRVKSITINCATHVPKNAGT